MKRLFLIGLALGLASTSFVSAQEAEGIAEDLTVYRDPDRLLALIENPPEGFYLVDTRTYDEYVSGHMPGAIHRDYREIGGDLPTEDRDAVIFVYCLSGVRSNRAERTLRRLGFNRVLNWGGILDWPHEVVTGPSP
jgi:phage shock protein E